MQLDQKALIEEAVQASIDAGLAVNGEYGVAAARHAARFMFNALQAVQPVPVVTDEMTRQAKKQIILAMQLYDFGSVSEDGAFTCSSQQVELLENRAEVAAHQALTAALTATASAEPVADGFRGFVPHGSYCATEGCGNFATVHFIRGGVGSFYCQECYRKVQALGRSPSSTGRQSG